MRQMKIIGTLGLAVMASIALVQPAQGSSRGSGRSVSSAPHFSAPAARSSGQQRGFSASPRRYYPSAARFSSGATFRNRSSAGSSRRLAINRTTALSPGFYSASGPRLAAGRRANLNPKNYSSARLAAGRTGALRSSGFNQQSRVVARYGNNWHRNWDRRRDHFWRGHRCHWHNNSWLVFATGFYPYGFGYYPYGYYPYGAYSYYDDGYYDGSYASNEYSQQSYSAQTEYDDSDADDSVSQVQSALAREGYYDGPVDGSLGPATRNALRRYQRDHGLEVTGGINRAVIEALRSR